MRSLPSLPLVVELKFEKRRIEGVSENWVEKINSNNSSKGNEFIEVWIPVEESWICKILFISKCFWISWKKINESIGIIAAGRIQTIEVEPLFHGGKKMSSTEKEVSILTSSSFDGDDDKLFGREKSDKIRIKECEGDWEDEEVSWGSYLSWRI